VKERWEEGAWKKKMANEMQKDEKINIYLN
jgi:hypothetical protein